MLRTDTGSNVESTEKEVPATAEHSVGRFKALRPCSIGIDDVEAQQKRTQASTGDEEAWFRMV